MSEENCFKKSTKHILEEGWRIFREQFGVIAAVVVMVWLPCELLSSYMDAFVFDPDDFRRSIKLSLFQENVFGIIATAGVMSIALAASSAEKVTLGDAMMAGFSVWGHMWWTRLLSSLVIVIGFLLLIIPGVYLLTRLCFVESIVVAERLSGTRAMRRSFEITKEHFWPTFRLGLVLLLLLMVPVVILNLPAFFIPALDHWLVTVVINLVCDVLAAFITIAFLCGYQTYASQPPSNPVSNVN